MYRVVVLQPGYSIMEEDGSMKANGTSTLVVSSYHITLSKLAEALTKIHGSDWRGACGVGWHPFSLGQRTPTVFTGRGRANSRRCHPSCKVLSLICSSFVSWIEPVICLNMLDYQKFFIWCLKVCTHGHPDHVGNNNLFTSAKVQSVKYLSSKQSILTLRCT